MAPNGMPRCIIIVYHEITSYGFQQSSLLPNTCGTATGVIHPNPESFRRPHLSSHMRLCETSQSTSNLGGSSPLPKRIDIRDACAVDRMCQLSETKDQMR